jgi:hypothetical protein
MTNKFGWTPTEIQHVQQLTLRSFTRGLSLGLALSYLPIYFPKSAAMMLQVFEPLGVFVLIFVLWAWIPKSWYGDE